MEGRPLILAALATVAPGCRAESGSSPAPLGPPPPATAPPPESATVTLQRETVRALEEHVQHQDWFDRAVEAIVRFDWPQITFLSLAFFVAAWLRAKGKLRIPYVDEPKQNGT